MSHSSATTGFLPSTADEPQLAVLLDAIGHEPVSREMLSLAAALQDAARAQEAWAAQARQPGL